MGAGRLPESEALPGGGGRKSGLTEKLLHIDRRARQAFYLALGAGWFAGALFAIQAVLVSLVIERVFLHQQGWQDVLGLLLVAFGLLVLRSGLLWGESVLAQRSASRIKAALRQQISRRLFALGPVYLVGERAGELVNTSTEGVELLDAYLTEYLPRRYLAFLLTGFVFLLVLALDPLTSLVLIFAGPMLILMLALIGGRARALTERRFLELSWMSAFFLDVLQGLATLKAFGRSKEQAENIQEISQRYGSTTMDVLATAFQSSLVMEWAATAATAMVALEVSLRLMDGGLAFSRALAVLLLTPEFFLPLRQMAIRYHAGTAGKAAAERIFGILGAPAPADVHVELARSPAELPAPVMQSVSLRFADVSLFYPGAARPALDHLSLDIPAGSALALVGPSGAGKSTLANLLLRFIEPTSGEILANGRSLASIDLAAWRARLTWVPQKPHLFQGNAADNIRLGSPQAGMDEVIAAAEAANADEFIRRLPYGYNTQIGEGGARLSGGQRQRIAIARAFLKKIETSETPPVLVLDEATAYLDEANEVMVSQALERLRQGRTVLIISHRFKLAESADQIAVLDQGRLVELGDHGSLLAKGGLYARLYHQAQHGGGIDGRGLYG